MVDKEMLAAISELLDQKLEEKLEEKLEIKLEAKFEAKLRPIYDRLDRLEADMEYIKVVQLENNVIPRLNTIEACYLDAFKRFMERTEQIDAIQIQIPPEIHSAFPSNLPHILPDKSTRYI